MTQVEMIEKVAAEAQISKAAAGRLIDFIGRMILTELLLDSKSSFPGLGIFSVVERAARNRINPQTKQSIGVQPPFKTVKFKPYKDVKEQIRSLPVSQA